MVGSQQKRNWFPVFLLGILSVLAVFLVVFIWPLLNKPRDPLNESPMAVELGQSWLGPIAATTKITVQQTYSLCQHTQVVPVEVDSALEGLSVKQLKERYPASQGWQVKIDGPDRIIIQQTLDGFCPADAQKRHLGVIDSRVAIFIGPMGIDREVEKVTEINVARLPPELREQIRLGMLEFANSDDLQQALDSLDEYQ